MQEPSYKQLEVKTNRTEHRFYADVTTPNAARKETRQDNTKKNKKNMSNTDPTLKTGVNSGAREL